MKPEILLEEIIKASPKSVYGLIAKNCRNDRMMQTEFFIELYDDLLSDVDTFTTTFGIEVARSLAKLVKLN